jgi:hypothetical protein
MSPTMLALLHLCADEPGLRQARGEASYACRDAGVQALETP